VSQGMTTELEEQLQDLDDNASFAQRAITLLKEYSSKLKILIDQTHAVLSQSTGVFWRKLSAIRDERKHKLTQLKYLLPPSQELARRVSGMIAHGKFSDFERTELTIRLAEFEANLTTIQHLLDTHRYKY
jgi:chromosome segregation ATPase